MGSSTTIQLSTIPFRSSVAVSRHPVIDTRRCHCSSSNLACRLASLHALLESEAEDLLLASERWQDTGLVSTTHLGAAPRRGERSEVVQAGMQGTGGRRRLDASRAGTSFVSLMSHHGVSTEEPRLCRVPVSAMMI